MFLSPRTLPIIFLALLQLIAPLVHAHAGGAMVFAAQNAGKLHVPGLESLNGQEAMYAFSQDDDYCAAVLSAPPEGMVIGVDSGIRQDQNLDEDSDNAGKLYCFPESTVFLHPKKLVSGNVAPRAPPLLSGGYVFSPHSPRAPPVI